MTLQLAEGQKVADRFRLIRELGRGGMGAVWLAEHIGLEVPCAIKFIDKEGRQDDQLRTRFAREAKAAAQLRSPNVVQILDYGMWGEVPYIAMEYLEGEDLAQRLNRVWLLSPGETCYIIAQVARALGKAHAAGIVHRDLKPENIFLSRDGEEEIAKVLDFGIAKRSKTELDDGGTKTGSLLGSPFYMSPEQARGVKTVDYRSDLWSLAIIVYQCVTGQLPFESEGLGDLLTKIMYEPLPVPSQIRPELPSSFDAWWCKAAARDVVQRYQSAKDLTDELAIALGVTQRIELAALIPKVDSPSFTNLPAYDPNAPGGANFGRRARHSPHAATLDGTTDKPLSSSASRRLKIVYATGAAAMLTVLGLLTFLALSSKEAPASAAPAAEPVQAEQTVAKSEEVDLDSVVTDALPAPSTSASTSEPEQTVPEQEPAEATPVRKKPRSRTTKKLESKPGGRVDFGI
jgi:serine/threonine-protein kinase